MQVATICQPPLLQEAPRENWGVKDTGALAGTQAHPGHYRDIYSLFLPHAVGTASTRLCVLGSPFLVPSPRPRSTVQVAAGPSCGSQTPHGSTAQPERFQLAPPPSPPLGAGASEVSCRPPEWAGGGSESWGEPRCLKGVLFFLQSQARRSSTSESNSNLIFCGRADSSRDVPLPGRDPGSCF